MNTTATATRMHPLMATAAASVIIVSLTGAAAITGLLPSSRGSAQPAMTSSAAPGVTAPAAPAMIAAAAPGMTAAAAPGMAAPGMPLAAGQYQVNPVPQAVSHYAAPAPQAPAPYVVTAAPGTTTYVQTGNPAAPVVIVKQEAAPVVKRTVVQKPRVVYHRPVQKVVRYEEPRYSRPAPAPVQAQPNYVGIGTGAVIGGLIGNQIGGGNGKKLATIAGVIGGGYLGNEIAKRNGQ